MKKIIILIALTMVVFSVSRAHAYVIFPTVDGTLFDFSDDGTVDFINYSEGVQALYNNDFQSRGIIEFDTSSIVNSVFSATLNLDVRSALGPYSYNLGFYTYSGDGSLTNEDYNDGALAFLFSYSGEDSLHLDVTTYLENSRINGDDYMGFNIRMMNETTVGNGPPYVSFDSLDYQNPAYLSVTESGNVVPEPSTMLLLGGGLLGAFVRRRRKN